MSIKATHQEALGFCMFHCFNISKHISISVLFFLISVSCFVGFFAGFLKVIAPRVGLYHYFSAPGVGVLHFSCARGGGISPFQKNPPKVSPGGMVRLGTDRYITRTRSLQLTGSVLITTIYCVNL